MALYAAARLSLPRILDASAATGPCGDATLAGATSGERGLRVAADGGHMAYGMSLLRGLPDVHLARKQWLTTASCEESVGDLSSDIAEQVLHHLFNSGYPSVKSAKMIFDKLTSRSKNCSTRPMLIGTAIYKKNFVHSTSRSHSYHDPNNARLVGHLDQRTPNDDDFSPYGELVNAKVSAGKGCGFLTFSNRASAGEAMETLNGSQLGGNDTRFSWGQYAANKQGQQNGDWHGLPEFSSDPSGFSWSPQNPYAYAQTGLPGYRYYQQLFVGYRELVNVELLAGKDCGFVKYSNRTSAEEAMRMLNGSQLGDDLMTLNAAAAIGTGLGFKRSYGGVNGGPEEEFWKWVERTRSKPFLEKLDRGLSGMGFDLPTGRMSRIFICALAYSVICQASKDWYDVYLVLVFAVSRYTPDSWYEFVAGVRERLLGNPMEDSTPEPLWELLCSA